MERAFRIPGATDIRMMDYACGESTVTFHRSRAFKAIMQRTSMSTRDLLSRTLSGSILAGCSFGRTSLDEFPSTTRRPSEQRDTDFSSNGKTWVLSSGSRVSENAGDTGPGPIMDKNFPGSAFDQQRGGERSAESPSAIRPIPS